VTVDERYLGTTPVSFELSSNQPHELRLSKQGYHTERHVLSLQPAEQRQLSVSLQPEFGTVFVSTTPADARLLLDGKPVTRDGPRLRLPVRTHRLQVVRDGYVSQTLTITPRAGISENVEVVLEKASNARASASTGKAANAPAATIETALGQTLHLVSPAAVFQMGASRREAGRRANESRRLVRLERPFYFAEHEVTNGDFRRFRAQHDAGSAEGASLNGDRQPAVNINWHDAARFCNWLSEQDGLPAAYREVVSAGESPLMELVRPVTTGYRMPSEAEWAYVSRVLGRQAPARYPWDGSYPPPPGAGNFADRSIADTLADVVPEYDDGFRTSAPVGSFSASTPGYYDLAGNVAEWTTDYYAVYPGAAGQPVTDPNGPPDGDHHVVRGASWRHGNITELRLSYRDYSQRARDDLGFRIARYAR
jgi:formylglycine-generating enzyme required for sulfatase activity